MNIVCLIEYSRRRGNIYGCILTTRQVKSDKKFWLQELFVPSSMIRSNHNSARGGNSGGVAAGGGGPTAGAGVSKWIICLLLLSAISVLTSIINGPPRGPTATFRQISAVASTATRADAAEEDVRNAAEEGIGQAHYQWSSSSPASDDHLYQKQQEKRLYATVSDIVNAAGDEDGDPAGGSIPAPRRKLPRIALLISFPNAVSSFCRWVVFLRRVFCDLGKPWLPT